MTYSVNLAGLATRIMVGIPLETVSIQPGDMDCITAKVPVFSLGRPKNSDSRLGVETQPTGKVACFGVSQYEVQAAHEERPPLHRPVLAEG